VCAYCSRFMHSTRRDNTATLKRSA
jgi:hypothetical protein